MAKIKLVKGKSLHTKRNLRRTLTTCLVYINTLALVYLALKLHNIL